MALMLFFIFGGIYLFIILNGKSNKATSKSQMKKINEIERIIRMNFVLNPNVKEKFFENRFNALEEIGNQLAFVVGDNWRDIYRNYPCYRGEYSFCRAYHQGYSDIWEMAFEIWLSKHGYISENLSEEYPLYAKVPGYSYEISPDINLGTDIIAAAKKETEMINSLARELNIRAHKVIEANIHRAHPQFNLRFAVDRSIDGGGVMRWDVWIENYGGRPTYLWSLEDTKNL